MTYLFDPTPPFVVPVGGSDLQYPVRRIFCVGRNYVAHAQEMGGEVDREAPWFFTKTPVNSVLSGQTVQFPQGTSNYHHEVELAAFLGAGANVIGYACALDMTRRDRQQDAKDARRPWSVGKDVENGAVFAPMAREFQPRDTTPIQLRVNGELRQDATLGEMVWSVPEILAHLSGFYQLGAGDVILTGTPAGVGSVQPGDRLEGFVDSLPPLSHALSEAI